MADNNNTATTKIISIESTVDGDIQTVEQCNNNDNSPEKNDSVRAFTHHLRDSWDEALNDGAAPTATPRTNLHKQNLSVQFLDINISGDDINEALGGGGDKPPSQNVEGEMQKRETIERTYHSKTPAADDSSSLKENKVGGTGETKATASNNDDDDDDDDKTNFTNFLRNSWNECEDDKKSASTSSSPRISHKPAPSVQFLDTTMLEYADHLPVIQSVETGVETEHYNVNASTTSATAEAFEPPVSKNKSPRKDQSSQISPREIVPKNNQKQQSSRRLGSDSPLSPRAPMEDEQPPRAALAESIDSIDPIPLMPTEPIPGAANRKHRRVLSGRNNHAVRHRRVNTRGDKTSPSRDSDFDFEGLVDSDIRVELVEQDHHHQQQRKKKTFNIAAPSYYGLPTQQQQQPPHPPYYSGTPPPSYYGGSHQQPAPYYNYSPSTQSDTGVNYNISRTSPVVSDYPQQQLLQPPLSSHSVPAAVGGTSSQKATIPRTNSYPLPNDLEQPILDEEYPLPQAEAELRIHTDEKLFGDMKEMSFNPLPFVNDNNDDKHHRKQSSLGSFLAHAALFDDDLFDEDEGYASAPEEGDSKKMLSHNKTLSSASFMRSLSSDDFLRQLNEEEAKESASAAAASARMPQQQQQQQQQAPPPPPPPPNHPSHLPTPPNGYPMHSTSPVVSYPHAPPPPHLAAPGYHHPPTPPGSLPMYPTGSYPTPPGSERGYHSQSSTGSGSYPSTPTGYYQYGTPPQSMMMWPAQQPPPPYASGSPNLPMHYSPDPQQMQYHHQSPNQQQPVGYIMKQAPPLQQQPMFCSPAPSTTASAGDKGTGSRRKCSVPECQNRVVQGGVCITHGAKRKTCNHPGCTKNVKVAGKCSTHGPARKRCEFEGCVKVAVQGGRCIAHGAKKKNCSYEECTKQAILGGMCKKHYDVVNGVVKNRNRGGQQKKPAPKKQQANHQRGLSLFQDNELMDTIINNGAPPTPPVENDGLHGLSAI